MTSERKMKKVVSGKGTITYDNGDVYDGEFQDAEPHGVGKMTYKDGRICEGIWNEGKIEYEGELNGDGEPHGRGKWIYSNGTYEGKWKNGNRRGEGTLKYNSGDVYVGQYKDDKRSGRSTYTWSDGSSYEGQELEITSDRIANGEANTIVHDGEATQKEKEDALHRALVDLTMCFFTDGPPPGTYVMDPLSCIPFDPNSDWNITNNVSSGKDQWWSRLKYEFETKQHGLVRGDVLPIFGAHLDLHPRSTTSKLKNYGKNLVIVYLPTETVSYLCKAVKEKTGMNIAEGKEIVDMTQGLTSFLMGASKGVDTIPCKMYQAVLDEEDGQVVKYNIGKVPLNQLYKGANTDQNIRVMGGVAFVHLGVTFSCAPDEIPRAGQVPPGSLIDLKFKLVSFHCLSVTGRKINKITYKTATTREY